MGLNLKGIALDSKKFSVQNEDFQVTIPEAIRGGVDGNCDVAIMEKPGNFSIKVKSHGGDFLYHVDVEGRRTFNEGAMLLSPRMNDSENLHQGPVTSNKKFYFDGTEAEIRNYTGLIQITYYRGTAVVEEKKEVENSRGIKEKNFKNYYEPIANYKVKDLGERHVILIRLKLNNENT